MAIKFVDLRRQYETIRDEIEIAIQQALESADFVMGTELRKFEEDFARYCGTRYAVGVGSGTSALQIALQGLGLEPGSEVIIPANTYIATALAVTQAGGTPILVDVDSETYAVGPRAIEAAISPRTAGIIPVHLYGRVAPMDSLLSLAHSRGLFVLEDACQAHGAMLNGKRAGSFGHAAAFSFYPGKNLGAYGDGGAVTTNDQHLYERMLTLRDFGQVRKYHHTIKGTNSRLDTIQAAVLRVKLARLDGWNAQRRNAAAVYDEFFRSSPVSVSSFRPNENPVHHLYVVRVQNRDCITATLRNSDIEFGIHYPTPIHLQPAYSELKGLAGTLPVTERYAKEILSLPMFPEITVGEIERVATVILSECGVPA